VTPTVWLMLGGAGTVGWMWLVLWLLARHSRRLDSADEGLRILEPTRRWDEWVNEALAVADDRPPPSRRLR
jgi:hypothetical protein